MFNGLKNSCVALAAATVIALPIHSASAQEATVVGRVVDGQVYELQPTSPAVAFRAGTVPGAPMVIRNDYNTSTALSVPAEALPPAGACRLWYPDRSTAIQPGVSACDVAVPRGAVLLIN